jgi:hypothetical protein
LPTTSFHRQLGADGALAFRIRIAFQGIGHRRNGGSLVSLDYRPA